MPEELTDVGKPCFLSSFSLLQRQDDIHIPKASWDAMLINDSYKVFWNPGRLPAFSIITGKSEDLLAEQIPLSKVTDVGRRLGGSLQLNPHSSPIAHLPLTLPCVGNNTL